MFDFVLNQWKEYLASSSKPQPLARAAEFASASFASSENAKNGMEKIAALLSAGAEMNGKNRQNAKLFWRADLFALPFDNPATFTFEDEKAERLEAARQLEELSGVKPAKKGLFGRIKGFVAPEKALYGKAYAALRAAQLYNDAQEYATAVSICDYAHKNLGSNYYSKACANLAANIQAPSLSVTPAPMNQNPQDLTLEVTARNIPSVFVRLYPVTRGELKQYSLDRWNRTVNSWNHLTNVNDEALRKILTAKKPLKTLSGSVTYDKPHAFKKTDLKLPALPSGFYVAALSQDASFNPDAAPVLAAVLNVTDLTLFVSAAVRDNPDKYTPVLNAKPVTYTPNIFRVYAVNLKTGEPVAGANLDIFTEWKGTRKQGRTDEDGLFELSQKITVNGRGGNSYFVNPLAVKGHDTAFTSSAVYFHFNGQDPVRLFAQTDRAIYRPGQKVQFSVNAFEQVVRGLRTLTGRSVNVEIRDANYSKIYSAAVELNDMGTAAGAFTLPKDTLLGAFSLEASLSAGGRTFRTYAHFRTDDYKRPDYEVTFADASSAFEYGKTAVAEGSARYYFGAPLQKADVKYTVYRADFAPPFFWWLPRAFFFQKEEFVTAGQTQTDDKGKFKIEFTPRPAQNAQDAVRPARYKIKAEVFDESGRVITAEGVYKAAAKPHFFDVEFTQGFYDAQTAARLARVKLADINGNPAHGKVTARVALLENKLDQTALPKRFFPEEDGSLLDKAFGKNKELKPIFTRELDLRETDGTDLSLPALPEGVYRLTLSSQKADDVSLVFLVAQENSKLDLPSVALPQHAVYYPGSDAKFLLGAGGLNGPKRVEIYAGQDFMVGKRTLGPGVSILTLPVENEYRGGLGVRWFGASDYRVYRDTAFVEIPFDKKKLTVDFSVPADVQPGQRVQWALSAKDVTGAGVQGQASITVYDKALDYYAKTENRLSLSALFPSARPLGSVGDSLFDVSASTAAGKDAYPQPPFADNRPQPLPQLNLNPVLRVMGAYGMTRSLSRGVMFKSAEINSSPAVAQDAVMEETAALPMASAKQTDAGTAQDGTPETAVRTDFSETAYFNPALPLNAGKASVNFTMPQSLTEWNILGFVLTRAADFGSFAASTVTRQDFMVRLQLPRFLREGDKTALQAAVTNLTKKKLTAEVELSVKQNGLDAKDAFGVKKERKTVSVPAGQTVFAAWDVTVPSGPEMTDFTVTARAGKDADGEAKSIPVLPGLQRLLATSNTVLKEGPNTLEVTEPASVPDARPQTAVLQINPSLALSVFNSVPHLLTPKRDDLISVLNRYTPLAVVNQFYNCYPEMKKAVSRLPARAAVSPAWDQTDPLRLTLLNETPWLNISQGRKAQEGDLISLFEPETVKRQQSKTQTALKKYQNADGAFSWLPGGRDDEYLTLYALENFAQALRYGAQIPQAMAQKAYAFSVSSVNRRLSESKTANAGDVATALYAAYVLSAFPQEWKEVQNAREDVAKWAAYADKYARFMTPLGKIYAAAVFHRLGDEVKAQKYLDLTLSLLKENPLTGAYFAPEAQSWVWYNDTLTTQTVTLQTLLEMRPDSDKTAALARWLLFNRKANEWDSPRAAAQAVFALLNYMNQKGLTNQATSYAISWGPVKETLSFKPFDWTEDPRYVRRSNVTPELYSASIAKKGGAEDFASLSVVYTAPRAKPSPKGVINVTREYFLKYTQDGVTRLRSLEDLTPVKTGDEVEVRLTVTTDSAFEYVLLTDPKPAGFESDALLSGWTADPLRMYRENKDAATNFYLNWLPAGTVTITYTLRPGTAGQYRAPAAQIQSMYAPEFGAHTGSETLRVN